MRDYSKIRHPFDRTLNELARKGIEWGEPDDKGNRTGKMPSFESDESNLEDAADWLEKEAEAGNVTGLMERFSEDGGTNYLFSHPKRNALIWVKVSKDGYYDKIKIE